MSYMRWREAIERDRVQAAASALLAKWPELQVSTWTLAMTLGLCITVWDTKRKLSQRITIGV
jgi:hypothetical protein